MDYFALLLPILLIVALFAGLVLLKRHLFSEQESPAPVPIPDAEVTRENPPPAPAPRRQPLEQAAGAGNGNEEAPSLSPARPYPRRPLGDEHMTVFSRLLKALPGYVVLPKISYEHFLEARDGSPSENTSLQNRAAQHLADFLICDKKLRVLLVCQVEDGTQLPARIQEREKLLQKAGLRLLRWKVSAPPDPNSLLNTVRTLEKLSSTGDTRDASSRDSARGSGK